MDIEIIEVEVDDQAQTSALNALSDAAAAQALRVETKRAPSPRITPPTMAKVSAPPAPKPKLKADGTQEIELGDVLEVMQKMPGSKSAVAAVPTVELAATPLESPPAPITTAAPINPNATVEIRPGDVLEEIVIEEPAASQPIAMAPIPVAANSGSDLAQTVIRPPSRNTDASASIPIPQFAVDEEVAPFASDTVDIPLNRVAGLPIWLQIKGKPGVAIVGGAIGACALIGALAIGMHFHNASDNLAARTTRSATTTTAAMNHDDPSAAIPPPPAEPDVPSVSIDDLQKDGHPGASSPPPPASRPWGGTQHAQAHTVTHHVAAVTAQPKTNASSKPQGFGLIRTWIAARGEPIAVDGKVVGVAPSPVRVACGDHTIAIGKEVVHANVPCDGAVTVGSPDHKK